MLEYVQKDGDPSLIDNIKNIIDPENFIERHNIEEQDLYSQVIKEEDMLK